jgi:hypothetical protein
MQPISSLMRSTDSINLFSTTDIASIHGIVTAGLHILTSLASLQILWLAFSLLPDLTQDAF